VKVVRAFERHAGAFARCDVEHERGTVPALVLLGVDEERATVDLVEEEVVRPDEKLPLREAHRGAAVAAAPRLEEHQRTVLGAQAPVVVQRHLHARHAELVLALAEERHRAVGGDVIRDLRTEGTTLLLTTQYLDEADRLADSIAVIDGGRVIAEGTSDQLKARVGGEVLALRVADRGRAPDAAGAVLGLGPGGGNVDNSTGEINVPVGTEGTAILTEAVRRLDDQGIQLADVGLRRPTLDDVFLALTGHAAEEADGEQPSEDGRSKRRDRKREREREKV